MGKQLVAEKHRYRGAAARPLRSVRKRATEAKRLRGSRAVVVRLHKGQRKSFSSICPVEFGEISFQCFQFGQVVVNDIRIIRIVLEVVLMVAFRRVKGLKRLYLRHDFPGIDFRSIELRDIRLSNPLLFFVGVKNHGAILRSGIRALSVPLRRIVRDGKEHPQELAVGDLRGIVRDAHGLGMTGHSHADALIRRRLDVAAGVAGGHGRHSLHVLEYRLYAPEASSRENHRLLALDGGERRIDRRRGNMGFRSFGWSRAQSAYGSPRGHSHDQGKGNASTQIGALHDVLLAAFLISSWKQSFGVYWMLPHLFRMAPPCLKKKAGPAGRDHDLGDSTAYFRKEGRVGTDSRGEAS